VFENRVLRRILGPKRDEVTEGWRNYITRNFITCTLRKEEEKQSNHGV
jgi:hypothetical protein